MAKVNRSREEVRKAIDGNLERERVEKEIEELIAKSPSYEELDHLNSMNIQEIGNLTGELESLEKVHLGLLKNHLEIMRENRDQRTQIIELMAA